MLRKLIISLPLFVALVAVAIITTPLLPTTAVSDTSAAASNVTSPTNATTGGGAAAANNVTTNSNSTIATTQSEILWESEVRERRERAGLPLENNSTLPNLIKSPESLEIDKLQAQDPKFANFETILDQCHNNGDGDPSNDIIPHSQCLARLEEASAMWCGIETYDAKKCDYVSNQSTWYESLYSVFSILQSP